jgi:hypothetical protein
VSRAPWNALKVPRVVINVGSLNWEIRKALTAPRMIPTQQDITKAKMILFTPNATRRFTAMYCPAIAIAVNETSIPPDRRTMKTPIARMAIPALLLIRSNRFSIARKEGLILVMIAENTTMITSKYDSFLRNILLNTWPRITWVL